MHKGPQRRPNILKSFLSWGPRNRKIQPETLKPKALDAPAAKLGACPARPALSLSLPLSVIISCLRCLRKGSSEADLLQGMGYGVYFSTVMLQNCSKVLQEVVWVEGAASFQLKLTQLSFQPFRIGTACPGIFLHRRSRMAPTGGTQCRDLPGVFLDRCE